jgi:hypothetical protein
MGDAGEGLIDAESRIQERMEELERARAAHRSEVRNPEAVRQLESLRLTRAEIERQMNTATHERRRAALQQALADVDRKMAELHAQLA